MKYTKPTGRVESDLLVPQSAYRRQAESFVKKMESNGFVVDREVGTIQKGKKIYTYPHSAQLIADAVGGIGGVQKVRSNSATWRSFKKSLTDSGLSTVRKDSKPTPKALRSRTITGTTEWKSL